MAESPLEWDYFRSSVTVRVTIEEIGSRHYVPVGILIGLCYLGGDPWRGRVGAALEMVE